MTNSVAAMLVAAALTAPVLEEGVQGLSGRDAADGGATGETRGHTAGNVGLKAVCCPGCAGRTAQSTPLRSTALGPPPRKHRPPSQAVKAMKQWSFKPGRQGMASPSPSAFSMEMTFTLK